MDGRFGAVSDEGESAPFPLFAPVLTGPFLMPKIGV